MPQFWLSYDELGTLMGCDAEAARAAAAAIPLDRRRSHDGQTRAKLNLALTEIFLDRLVQRRLDQQLQACAGELKALHRRMAAPQAHAAPAHAAPSGRAAAGG